ncbi:MAG: tryptophan synthase subunit alpha [Thermodesulfobacteria bacterium]|nr:tryptophan synthase subunit alpha [Thermodesulfobacteriota bacterium]
MNRIDKAFKNLRKEGGCALIPFVTAGDPNPDATVEVVVEMAKQGADIIELGMPFSDPLADGPTIQAASFRALEGGMNPDVYFDVVRRIREQTDIPLVLMGYYNPVLKMGLGTFAERAVEAGIDGTIIPDLPLEEADEWRKEARRVGLANILLVAPNTPTSRVKRIVKASSGFTYYVSVLGITGARTELPPELAQGLKRVKECSTKPVAVGFGISRPEQVRGLRDVADGIIVGSAIVKMLHDTFAQKGLKDAVESVGNFVGELKKATLKGEEV